MAKEITPHVDEWDEAGTFPRELYARAADVGLLAGLVRAASEFATSRTDEGSG